MLVAASILVLTAVVIAVMHGDKERAAVKVKAEAKDRRQSER